MRYIENCIHFLIYILNQDTKFKEPNLVKKIIEHYNYNGKYEFHRMPNPCYLKKKGVDSFFAGGSCFYTNRAFIDIFKNINLDYEFDLLEEGYIKNDTPKKTHAWEYFFGYLCYIYKERSCET